jgi:hypothetical protein
MIDLLAVSPSMDKIEKLLVDAKTTIEKMESDCSVARRNAEDGNHTLTEWVLTRIAHGAEDLKTCARSIYAALPEEY